MPYQLKRKESVADGIRRIAAEQFSRAAGELRSSHRPEIVHSARKPLKGLCRSLEKSQESGAAARRSRSDELWHEWRKRTKDFWYHLRLVRGVWPTIMDGAIGQFKALADDLGDDHDLGRRVSFSRGGG